MKFRRSVIDQNLLIAYPESSTLRKSIVRASYYSLGNLFLEVFMVLKPPFQSEASIKQFVLNSVDFSGLEHLTEAWKSGRGVIFLASHLGNWEVMAATGGVLAQADLMLVTKRLQPSWLHQAIEEGRASYGVSAAYEPKTVRQILKHLKKKNAAVGFVLDQYVGPPVGVRVPLFGTPVGTALAVAALAKRTGSVVLPVENFRKAKGRWQVTIHPPLPWKAFKEEDSHFELAANTAQFTQFIEGSIYAHPEQWLWIHRRFKGDLEPLREGEWHQPRVRE